MEQIVAAQDGNIDPETGLVHMPGDAKPKARQMADQQMQIIVTSTNRVIDLREKLKRHRAVCTGMVAKKVSIGYDRHRALRDYQAGRGAWAECVRKEKSRVRSLEYRKKQFRQLDEKMQTGTPKTKQQAKEKLEEMDNNTAKERVWTSLTDPKPRKRKRIETETQKEKEAQRQRDKKRRKKYRDAQAHHMPH